MNEEIRSLKNQDQKNQEDGFRFYRVRCPKCGEAALDVIDSGVFIRSPLVGITSDGEIGCSHTELDDGYDFGILCRDCEHAIFTDSSFSNECEDGFLLEWAKSNGEVLKPVTFNCPKCDSRRLYFFEENVKFSHEVSAVCESDIPGGSPLIALSPILHIGRGGLYRYRCSRGHELANDAGNPVETPEELMEWLKSRRASVKG
jgi:hypothetical protein